MLHYKLNKFTEVLRLKRRKNTQIVAFQLVNFLYSLLLILTVYFIGIPLVC